MQENHRSGSVSALTECFRPAPIRRLGCKVMIEFHLSVDALGKTRFAYSPLAEVACSLRLLGEVRHAYVMLPWLRDVRGPLQRLDFNLLQTLAPPGRWAPDFLFAWSYNPAITIEQQLDAMSRLPGEQIHNDLRDTWKDGTVPPNLSALLADQKDARGAGQRLDLRLLAGRHRPLLAANPQRPRRRRRLPGNEGVHRWDLHHVHRPAS
jgi:hypothetical protein